MFKLEEKTLVYLVSQPKWILRLRAPTETVEYPSRTVEDGRGQSRTAVESICGLDVNQNMFQPTKCIQLTPHKAPELTKLQAASYEGVWKTWSLELAHEITLRRENRSFSCSWKPVRRNRYPV